MSDKYIYYCDDCKCFVEKNHRCQQWGTVSQMPKKAMELWVKKSTPKHETVSQWEERTGEVYPDDGPVWVWTVNNPSCRKKWRLMRHLFTRSYSDTCKIIVANHHGKPETDSEDNEENCYNCDNFEVCSKNPNLKLRQDCEGDGTKWKQRKEINNIKRMTKPEALTAIKEGHKVTRQYFGDDEFIWMDKEGTIRSEEGYDFTDWWYDIEPNIQTVNRTPWSIYIQEQKGDSDEV